MFEFNLQQFALNLPVNPSTNSATVGKNFLLYINIGSATIPVWSLIGGQRNSKLGRTASSVDTSNKATGGWGSKLPGIRSWNIDLDGLVLLANDGVDALEAAYDAGITVNLKFEYPNQKYRTGWAAITDMSIDTAHDGAATLTCKLEGDGKLSSILGNDITPIAAVMSKGDVKDLVFNISPAAQTVKEIKCDETTVLAANYSYTNAILTIKGTYLSTLTNGVHVFDITPTTDNSLTVRVQITD